VGKRIDILCDAGPANDGDLSVYAGVSYIYPIGGLRYDITYNHYITYLIASSNGVGTVTNIGNPTYGWAKIYSASKMGTEANTGVGGTIGTRMIYARPNPSNLAQLQIGQISSG
jgi:hypothetical protein